MITELSEIAVTFPPVLADAGSQFKDMPETIGVLNQSPGPCNTTDDLPACIDLKGTLEAALRYFCFRHFCFHLHPQMRPLTDLVSPQHCSKSLANHVATHRLLQIRLDFENAEKKHRHPDAYSHPFFTWLVHVLHQRAHDRSRD